MVQRMSNKRSVSSSRTRKSQLVPMDSPSTMVEHQLEVFHLLNHVAKETGNQRNSKKQENYYSKMCWLTGGQATDEHTPPTKPRDRPWKRSLILIGNTSSNLHLSESALGLRMVAHNRTIPTPSSHRRARTCENWNGALRRGCAVLRSQKKIGSNPWFLLTYCAMGWAFKRYHLEDI